MHDVCVSVKDHLTQFCQFIYKPNTKEKGMNIFDEGGVGGKAHWICMYVMQSQKKEYDIKYFILLSFPEIGKKR